ncbi:Linoleate 9S-lipoxygenase 2 [Linum perenne]
MEKGSFRNGTGSMTMLVTMIWEILIVIPSMIGRLLEDQLNSLILAGEEPEGHHQNQVISMTLALFDGLDFGLESRTAWRTDQEFAREMLAGLNPVIIRLLQELPPRSKLDRKVYGNQDSSITEEHIMNQLNGLTIVEEINNKKIFILDHHDTVMPYLRKINNTTKTKTYATRTILFLQNDSELQSWWKELVEVGHGDKKHEPWWPKMQNQKELIETCT